MMLYTVKQLARASLNYLGYDLYKLPVKLRRRPSLKSGGKSWRIEFIGPSGIGKTTIYNELLRQRQRTDHWLVADELYPLDSCLIANENLLSDKYTGLLELQFARITAQDLPIADRYMALSYYYKIIIQDAKIEKSSPPYDILLQEGIFHNFPDALMEMASAPGSVDDLLTRRGIIHCVAPPELIAERIRQREKEQGYMLFVHEGLTQKELVADNAKELAIRAELARRLGQYRLPRLELNMANEIAANVEIIRQFINSLE